jgi:hypothetical protein
MVVEREVAQCGRAEKFKQPRAPEAKGGVVRSPTFPQESKVQ